MSERSDCDEDLQPDIISSLLDSLVIVSDPRKKRGKRHLLIDILTIAVLGCMCGCDNAEAIKDWAEKEKQWLSRFLTLQHGIPSQDVYLRASGEIGQITQITLWQK